MKEKTPNYPAVKQDLIRGCMIGGAVGDALGVLGIVAVREA